MDFTQILVFLLGICVYKTEGEEPDLLKLQMEFQYRNPREAVGKPKETCKVSCTNAKQRPVCGTDGRTYNSKCHVKRLKRCEGVNVEVQSKGRCRDIRIGFEMAMKPGATCFKEREKSMSTTQTPSPDLYIPVCKSDGTHAEVQCHKGTGYCWCVTSDGKHIAGSSMKGKKINCRKHSRKPKGNAEKPSQKGDGNKKKRGAEGCGQSDRSQFNENLITLFSEEFARIPKPTPPHYPGAPKDLPIKSGSDALLDTPEKRVIEWKFSELDTDKDSSLKKKEIRALKRMVKKLVKPKSCARTFDTYCDLNQDGLVARDEWSVCLGVDINNEKGQMGQGPGAPKGGGRGGIKPNPHFSGLLSDSQHSRLLVNTAVGHRTFASSTSFLNLPGPTLWDKQAPLKSGLLTPSDGQFRETKPAVKRSCPEERALALEMDRSDPDGRQFIPTCQESGKYDEIQCHTATEYCWCVNEDIGKPIEGTSTHKIKPDCKRKEFKGCDYQQKKVFLTELLDTLTMELIIYANNTTNTNNFPEPKQNETLEERAVRWKLRMLDKNRSGTLERRELKTFKKEISKQQSLRKCGRNFIRYCDADSNKQISLQEWTECMGLNDQNKRNLMPENRRRGMNPLQKYLKPN